MPEPIKFSFLVAIIRGDNPRPNTCHRGIHTLFLATFGLPLILRFKSTWIRLHRAMARCGHN